MSKKTYLLFFTASLLFFKTNIHAQEAMHNYGNLKIHHEGALGFHHNLINDGITDDNKGIAGFFSDDYIIIDGAFSPIFNDIEIMVTNNLFLNTGIGLTNHINFISGNIITPRLSKDITINYIEKGNYSSDGNNRKIDGYSELTNKQNFIFPLGYENQLRALGINSTTTINNAKSAYFHENPNNPLNFNGVYRTSEKTDVLSKVSIYEFWDVESTSTCWIDLTWDAQSNLSTFVDKIEDLRIVGWHKNNKEWENLGGIGINGNLTSGSITSKAFIPDDYAMITFGSSYTNTNITLGNYILTPNNDGINDFLVIEEVELSPNNKIKIFNRWGRLVYSMKNYDNTFAGKANVSMVIEKKSNLPSGVYFYVIEFYDLQKKYKIICTYLKNKLLSLWLNNYFYNIDTAVYM